MKMRVQEVRHPHTLILAEFTPSAPPNGGTP
nr:MAG TPA: hypothetical protein [Caudoviricetes sp.]